jgi:hypothetical protein
MRTPQRTFVKGGGQTTHVRVPHSQARRAAIECGGGGYPLHCAKACACGHTRVPMLRHAHAHMDNDKLLREAYNAWHKWQCTLAPRDKKAWRKLAAQVRAAGCWPAHWIGMERVVSACVSNAIRRRDAA